MARDTARMANDRPPAMFIADSRGLDFLNSIATPVDKPIEFIGSGEDFLQWLCDARLVPAEILAALRHRAAPGQLDAIAAQARAMREWFRGFVDAYRGKPLPVNAVKKLGPLNRVLARDEEFGQIVACDHQPSDEAPSALKLEVQRRWRSPEALLIPIAKAMAELVCSEDFSDIKACEGHACTLFFLDRTRGRARRWCSMAICGNRAKQAAHRKRAKRTRGQRLRK
jgi:predicted RNA-binding Zn ribbon-like protein